MRKIYTILLFLVLPFVFLRLLWKSRREIVYRQRLSERLGYYPFKLKQCIWVHAVSMGEVIAATPLIKKLKIQYPDIPLLVTTMTPTGATQVKKSLSDVATQVYVPYDFPTFLNRFLDAMQPRIAIIMETELWPNMIALCKARNIPVCVLNARLSDKSARRYQRIAWLVKPMLQDITMIANHDEQDAKRFIALGANKENAIVTGNIKYDLELPKNLSHTAEQLRAQLGNDRFIWVAGSTHEGEEEIVLAAHRKLCEAVPRALLILVPRHPNRFDVVAKLSERSFTICRHSSDTQTKAEVYLGDTMGEMLLFYAAANVAFVGGSLVAHGGHNLLEPAVLRKPVLSGSSLYNFTEISSQLLAEKALVIVNDAESLTAQLIKLALDKEHQCQLGQRAWQVVDANRGALVKQLAVVEKYMH